MKRVQRTYLRAMFREYGADGAFEDWLRYVGGIEVQLHPRARATAIHPETGTPVELRWEPGTDEVIAFGTNLLPGQHLPHKELHLSAYLAALGIARGLPRDGANRTGKVRVTGGGEITVSGKGKTVRPPAPGKPPDLDFYRGLRDERDQLMVEGHSNPVTEIARRRSVEVGTVKSWLSRGHVYLTREGKKR